MVWFFVSVTRPGVWAFVSISIKPFKIPLEVDLRSLEGIERVLLF